MLKKKKIHHDYVGRDVRHGDVSSRERPQGKLHLRGYPGPCACGRKEEPAHGSRIPRHILPELVERFQPLQLQLGDGQLSESESGGRFVLLHLGEKDNE